LYDASARCQSLQIVRRRARGLLGIGAFIDVPVVLQAVFERGALHELPHALGVGARDGVWLERAFDQRHIRQVERQSFRPEDILNHRQEARAATQAVFEKALEPPREQLHERQHSLVQRDVDVVRRRIVGNRLRRFGCSGRLLERGNREQFVDGGRFVPLLDETVALGERGHLVGTDPLHKTIEMLSDTWFGTRAVRGFEEDFERTIELAFGLFEVAVL
jgi:hypothetical protein